MFFSCALHSSAHIELNRNLMSYEGSTITNQVIEAYE